VHPSGSSFRVWENNEKFMQMKNKCTQAKKDNAAWGATEQQENRNTFHAISD